MNSLLFSRCAFGFAIFAAFSLSVCWLGDGHQVAFLLESAWSWVIWCVVGAGAVVTKSFGSNLKLLGVPARKRPNHVDGV